MNEEQIRQLHREHFGTPSLPEKYVGTPKDKLKNILDVAKKKHNEACDEAESLIAKINELEAIEAEQTLMAGIDEADQTNEEDIQKKQALENQLPQIRGRLDELKELIEKLGGEIDVLEPYINSDLPDTNAQSTPGRHNGVCPFCGTEVPKAVDVCAGCGAEWKGDPNRGKGAGGIAAFLAIALGIWMGITGGAVMGILGFLTPLVLVSIMFKGEGPKRWWRRSNIN